MKRNSVNTHNLVGVALTILLLVGFAATAQAQTPNPLPSWNSGPAVSDADTPTPDQQAPAGTDATKPAPASDENWHVNATLYLWGAGIHGNLSALGHNLGFKASPADLLKKLHFGMMGVVGVRYKRLVILEVLLYMSLGTTKTKVFQLPTDPTISAEVKYKETILTPEFGVRVIQHEKINVDLLAGFRYWHMETTLNLTPAPANNLFNTSAKSWADPLIGARFQLPLSTKMTATVWGDYNPLAGVGAKLDYQIVAALSYKIKPKWALDAGWRYLYLDYRKTILDTQVAMSGVVLGVTYSIN